MEYRGYNAFVTYDNDRGILHGEVTDIRDVITFQGRSADEMPDAFRAAVDDYLLMCRERGKEPDPPFTGRVTLMVDSQTHIAMVGSARSRGKSLNTWLLDAVGNELHRDDE